jgi:predicted HTH domain antitoxin
MQTINVRQLKTNPSTALRDARTEMVVVMNRDKPDAVMIGFEQLDGLADFAHVRQAMAVSLFKDRLISLAGAAKLSGESVGVMLTRLARLGVPVADYDGPTLTSEVSLGADWLTSRA